MKVRTTFALVFCFVFCLLLILHTSPLPWRKSDNLNGVESIKKAPSLINKCIQSSLTTFKKFHNREFFRRRQLRCISTSGVLGYRAGWFVCFKPFSLYSNLMKCRLPLFYFIFLVRKGMIWQRAIIRICLM